MVNKVAINSGKTPYELTSASTEYGNKGSVIIEGIERSVSSRELNFVVYDNNVNNVVDSVCFDTYSEKMEAIRR